MWFYGRSECKLNLDISDLVFQADALVGLSYLIFFNQFMLRVELAKVKRLFNIFKSVECHSFILTTGFMKVFHG